MAQKYIRALIKITNKECYAKDFRNGKLFMNNLKYFIECEKKEIGDEIETTAAVIRQKSPYTGNNINLFLKEENDKYIPAFCMFALIGEKYSYQNRIILNNEKLKRFGDYAVIITNVEAFLSKIQEHSLYQSSVVKYINYYNLSGEDERAIFNPIVKKSIHFKHQSEFRVYSNQIRVSKDKDLNSLYGEEYINQDFTTLDLGDLQKITSDIMSTEDLFNGIKGIKLNKSNETTNVINNDLTSIKSYARNNHETTV